MTTKHDPWRLPALSSFGTQLRALEHSGAPAPGSTPPRRRLSQRLALAAALVTGLVIAVLEVVAPAGAQSPLNKAPREARRSSTVGFASVIEASLGGRAQTAIAERGQLDFRDRRFGTSLSIPGSGASYEERTIGSTLYLARHPSLRAAARARPWARFTLAHASAAGAQRGYMLMQPQVVFAVLEHVGGRVNRLGSTTIRGKAASEYTVATSLGAFLKAQYGPGFRGAGRHTRASMAVWLDRRGRPLRVVTTFTQPSARGLAQLVLRTDFSGYGRPVRITAPPRREQYRVPSARVGSLLQDPTRTLVAALFATATVPGSG